jgi:hypothetical protein
MLDDKFFKLAARFESLGQRKIDLAQGAWAVSWIRIAETTSDIMIATSKGAGFQ